MDKDVPVSHDVLMAAAVMRRAGIPEVVLTRAEMESINVPDVSRSFSLSGDTITIRLSDADAARLQPAPAAGKGWPQLSSGERVGVVIVSAMAAALTAAVFVLIVKGLIALAGRVW